MENRQQLNNNFVGMGTVGDDSLEKDQENGQHLLEDFKDLQNGRNQPSDML